jgi:hypothetical protein
MNILLILISFLSFNTYAKDWKKVIVKKLPPPIAEIEINKTTLSTIEKSLGKAQLVEKEKHYYEVSGFKYGLEITYKNKKVSQYSYTFVKNRPSIVELNLKLEDFSSYNPQNLAHAKFLHSADSEGEIIIDPVQKNVYSIKVLK